MKLQSIWSIALLSLLLATGCSDDDKVVTPTVGVAFKTTKIGLDEKGKDVDIVLSFSSKTTVKNTVTIGVAETAVSHGKEYATTPAVKSGKITVNIPIGVTEAKFSIQRKVDIFPENAKVKFAIEKIVGEKNTKISGNTSLEIVFKTVASTDGTFEPEVGGPSQPNLAFVDLSKAAKSSVKRTDWDLGFYSGKEDKVILNFSTFMMAKATDKNDLIKVGKADKDAVERKMHTFIIGSQKFMDHHDGDLSKTVIKISPTATDNKVYIINLGKGPKGTKRDGQPRGWRKIRVLKDGNGYKLQYAEIEAATFKEASIARDDAYNFSYFSLVSGRSIKIEPKKNDWDFSFSPCTVNLGTRAYAYSDYVRINRHGGIRAYMVDATKDKKITYDNFKKSDVDDTKFSEKTNAIGSNWRRLGPKGGSLLKNRYFILKDTESNLYKIEFTALTNDKGVRGYPQFKYDLLK